MTISGWRKNPIIYEINTWTWLHGLSVKYGRSITLGSVPDEELDRLSNWRFDAIWLMGVWERSPAGRKISQEHPGLQSEYRRALDDYAPEDVVGSPYAVHRYEVDSHLGGADELADLRQRLADRGLKLVLDFVPNHVAVDHPWTQAHPEYFVQATVGDLAAQPDHFFRPADADHDRILANGRDPYFPAWTDTAQLNAFSPALRAQALATLNTIAEQCDAVRCDMAMLVTNRVFAETWGDRVGAPPKTDYWEMIIPKVQDAHPDFLFISEVYWNMEWDLQQQGFDYTYDKVLYDRLRGGSVEQIISHLQADLGYQQHLVRFIENHDEVRAASALATRDRAAAVIITTLPGATLLHEGQLSGYRVKLPVQLGRRPLETARPDTLAFYHRLAEEVSNPIYHEGTWELCELGPAWEGSQSYRNLIAYTWRHGDDRRLIVVNYAGSSSRCRVPLPDLDLDGTKWALADVLVDERYERSGTEMAGDGLYVELGPWGTHVFQFEPVTP